jgi:outer membrane lipoprotein-sorting protein
MRSSRSALLFAFVLAALSATARQSSPPATQTPQRDAQAVTILQQSVAAMASTVPSDSSATGTVTVVEGSTTQTGAIQILTLGPTQTSETLNLTNGQRSIIYSNGDALETTATQSANPPLELIVTDQCADFPLPLLQAFLNTADESIAYVGPEVQNGQPVQHIRVWKTFQSKPSLQKLAPFSTRDVWTSSASGLPVEISYTRRAGGGSVPGIPVAVFYSKYTNVNGVLYPFEIKKSLNGTPWTTITISGVTFNNGLAASQFQVE